MKIIVGLGNPGAQYDKTRHNVGFKIVDYLVGDANWKLDKKFQALVCEKNGDIFVKPQTFMNLSGRATQKILAFYKVDMKDLISEIETIVNSGTKINIDYYLNEILDEEHQEEVFEYFREAEDDSIDAALKELGENEYTENDIRLMRILFLSEMGN